MKYANRDKSEWLALLRDQIRQWNEVIGGLSADQITRVPTGDYSLRQAVGHLWAWEQLTIAKLEAALEDHEIRFSLWPEPFEPGTGEAEDAVNAHIQAMTRDMPWDRLYADWQATLQRVAELAEKVPEEKLMTRGHYAWMRGYPLAGAIQTTVDHHGEHLADLKAHLGLFAASQ